MIGEPTIDPALGDKRRKALLAALQQAAGMSGFAGGMNQNQLPAYGAVGHGSVSGSGIRPVRSGNRPAAILNFLSLRGPGGYARGLSAFHQASGGLGTLIANPQAPSPLPPVSGSGGTVGTTGGSVPAAGNSISNGPATPVGNYNPSQPISDSNAPGMDGPDPYSAFPAPGSPGSGLIPLGGGLYVDTTLGQLVNLGGGGFTNIGPANGNPTGSHITGLQE